MSALPLEWPALPGRIRWINSILVPLDGTVHATVALPVAKALAELAAVALHIVHVGGHPELPRKRLELLGVKSEYLGVKSEYFAGAVLDQVTGQPAESITRLAADRPGSLLVMCTHTGADKPHRALGSVVEAVLSQVAGPVVLVQPERGQREWRIRRILFPHDGTPSSNAALGPAADLAQRAGAELMVLHVDAGPGVRPPREPGTLTAPRYVDQPQHEWPAWAQEFLERMRGLCPPPAAPKLRLFLLAGDPGAKIVHFTQQYEVDLLALAWHRCWDPGRAETLKMVIRHCGSPVLVLPASWTLPGLSASGVAVDAAGNLFIADSANDRIRKVTPPAQPLVSPGGLVNGATFGRGLAAGAIVSLFGDNLTYSTAMADRVPLPFSLGEVAVQMNGIRVPMFYVSPKQLNLQIPWEVAGKTQVTVTVAANGAASAPVEFTLNSVAPGIFSLNATGAGQGVVQIANTAMLAAPSRMLPGAPARPANRGEYVTIYCTGLGDVTNRPASGVAASSNPLSVALAIPTVTIAGRPAVVSFSGLTPGFVGLYQINVQVPGDAPTGDAVPLTVTQAGVQSNIVTVAVQ